MVSRGTEARVCPHPERVAGGKVGVIIENVHADYDVYHKDDKVDANEGKIND